MSFLGSAVLAVALLAGCGGGSNPDGTGQGERIVDPARVPSSTPVQNPTLYKISGDQISTSGGPPIAVTPAPTAGGGAGTYTVKGGDTCGTIASTHKITVEELLRANRTINESCSNLGIGDLLRIPGASGGSSTPATGTGGGSATTPAAGSGRTYTVASGDTCGAIAANQGVTVAALIALNGLDADCSLKIGQVLKIP